ncbi:GIY-YIG nuclease family protein [Bacillus salitolerans]|uniref:GIY-YIG nuclease family protein n=1 Tax=Bacillus salitolerans TaxID=1437434 RepID=A0ABW4LQ12_9BACI
METPSHYFYVVLCNDGSFYGGYTNQLERRIQVHNDGKGAKYTRVRTPVILLYSEVYDQKSDAMRAEYQFKQLKRKQKEIFLQERGVENVGTEKLST